MRQSSYAAANDSINGAFSAIMRLAKSKSVTMARPRRGMATALRVRAAAFKALGVSRQ